MILMSVSYAPDETMERCLEISRVLHERLPKCKTIFLCDENSAPEIAQKGPADVSGMEKQFIRERLAGKQYKARSFFAGATPDNNYTPTTPLTITVSENPYSFDEDNCGVLYVKSGGADSGRPVKLRKKPSTGQWFVNDIQCLADIRTPKEADEWA